MALPIIVPEEEDANINLIPIMNLFTALIPFLLLSAAFMHLSILKVTVPVVSQSDETDVAREFDKVTLTLRVHAGSYEVAAASDALSVGELNALSVRIPRSGADDKATLRVLAERAFTIKSKYPQSDTVMIVPDDDIPYADIVVVTDALRESQRQVQGLPVQVSLFPRVVLSSIAQ